MFQAVSKLIRWFVAVVLGWLAGGHSLAFARPSRPPPNPAVLPRFMQNAQGLWLYRHEWWPKGRAPTGVIFLSSGLGEHGHRYDGLAEFLASEMHVVVFSLDHQGHGLSEGCRKHVERFSHYVDDYCLFLRTVLSRNKELADLPRALIGHSMGGLIALYTLRRAAATRGAVLPDALFSFDAAIFSAPAIKPDPNVAKPVLVAIGNVLSRYIPKIGVSNSISNESICRNRQIVELACQDPLFPSSPMRARWGAEMLAAMQIVIDDTRAFSDTCPFLVVHGQDDRVVQLEGSQVLYRNSRREDKELRVYAGSFHEVINDIDYALVRSDIKFFLQACFKKH